MWNTTWSVSMLHSLPPLFGKTDSSTPNHWLIYKLTCRNAQTNIFQRFKIATGYTLIPTNSLLLSLHINWIKYRNTPNNYTKNLMCKKDNLTAQKIFWTWPDLSDRVPVLSKKKKKTMNHSVGMLENSDQYQTLVLFIEHEQSPSMPEQLPRLQNVFR